MALNSFVRFKRLLPQAPLIIVSVITVGSDGTSMVETAAGSKMRVIGTTVAAGKKAWLKDGIITGEAPEMQHYELTLT